MVGRRILSWLQHQRRCLSSARGGRTVLDVHTHVYTKAYLKMLRRRNIPPRVLQRDGEERLIILPGEDLDPSTQAGRPIGAAYWDLEVKMRFMDMHGITGSIVSLANPWLSFLPSDESTSVASEINDELQEMTEAGEARGRIWAFGILGNNVEGAIKELERLRSLRGIVGVIMGAHGLGRGLDDEALEPLYEAFPENLVLFIHPHYGLGNESFKNTGHSLPLALGFPFETTTQVARMILAGVLERHPRLKVLVAHAGGALPWLSGRLDMCVQCDAAGSRLPKPPSEYLKAMYFDSLIYDREAIEFAVEKLGGDRFVFGTDNPFFEGKDPEGSPWPSARTNLDILRGLDCEEAILGRNAMELFRLEGGSGLSR